MRDVDGSILKINCPVRILRD